MSNLPPANTVIGTWTDLEATGTLIYQTETFKGFVILNDDLPKGFIDACPHTGLTLGDENTPHYQTREGDALICRWHGALFRKDTGFCFGGPCAGKSLTPWPLIRQGNHIVTA